MSCGLTKGRSEPLCRDNIGGIKNVYLFPYVDLPYTSIGGVRGVEITSFPTNQTLYKYETTNANFSETISNDEDGISYEQSLTFTLYKQDLITTNELNRVANIDLRYLVEYNDGNFKMGGVYNGASLDSYTIESGSNKGSLNGYNLTFTSTEEFLAPFVADPLGIFSGFLLLEDAFNLLLEDSDKIRLE